VAEHRDDDPATLLRHIALGRHGGAIGPQVSGQGFAARSPKTAIRKNS
jgi:hypothetical protein